MVNEHLRGVDQWVEQLQRRVQRRSRRDHLQQVRPVGGVGEALLLAGGVTGQRGNQDARGSVRTSFAQNQMRRQVAGGPLTAQGRGVGSDGPHRVHQCGAFAGGCGHRASTRYYALDGAEGAAQRPARMETHRRGRGGACSRSLRVAIAGALTNGGSPAATLLGGQRWRQRLGRRWRGGRRGGSIRTVEVHHRFLADHLVALADDKRLRRHQVADSPVLGDECAVLGRRRRKRSAWHRHVLAPRGTRTRRQASCRSPRVSCPCYRIPPSHPPNGSAPWSRGSPGRRFPARHRPTAARRRATPHRPPQPWPTAQSNVQRSSSATTRPWHSGSCERPRRHTTESLGHRDRLSAVLRGTPSSYWASAQSRNDSCLSPSWLRGQASLLIQGDRPT